MVLSEPYIHLLDSILLIGPLVITVVERQHRTRGHFLIRAVRAGWCAGQTVAVGLYCASLLQCKAASVLCLAVQMRGGSVYSRWPCQQTAMRSLEGEWNWSFSSITMLLIWGSRGKIGLHFTRFVSPLFAEQMTAACTSLTLSRINGRWRLVYLFVGYFWVLLGHGFAKESGAGNINSWK